MRAPFFRHAGSRQLSGQPDRVLVELAHAGHEPAFEAIVIRYGAYLLGVARRVGASERAEDVVQQALLQACGALRRGEQVVELRAWLQRIVVNASVDLSRRSGPRSDAIQEKDALAEGVESAVERKEQLARLVRALAELPKRQREAIVMRELEGRPFDEIASAFGTSDGAARQLVRRARSRLRAGVTALVPPALLARISDSAELPAAGGIGAGAKIATAVAVGGSALALGTFAPSMDEPVTQPAQVRPAPRHRARVGEQPAKPSTRPAEQPREGSHSPTAREAPHPAAASAELVQEGNQQAGDSQGEAGAIGESNGEAHGEQGDTGQHDGGQG